MSGGGPVGQLTPARLGVHQVIGGGPLPAYIRRPHDERLRAVLDPENEYSRLVIVRGDALTGTSRAVYEAVTDVLADWVLESPATLAALAARVEAGIPARTVLWLGELRHFADADGGAELIDRLNDLLDINGRVVGIATIWPGYWDSYAAAAAAGRGAADPEAVVGRVLAGLDVLAEYDPASLNPAYGGIVDVPDRFTAAELTAAAEAGDPVLAAAVAAAGPDGQAVQYLGGARDLVARYDGPDADPYGQAIITAAMDAARLGYASPLPAALLREAAAGYLAEPDQAADRQEGGLAWATESGWALEAIASDTGYRLAGYLDQHGRRTRGDQLGPASFWAALAARTGGANDRGRLARAAQDRGLYRYAAALWTSAAAAGRTDAAAQLVVHARPDDAGRAARWAAGQASLDEPWDVARLVEALHAAGAGDALEILLARDPAARVSLEHRWDIAGLYRALRAAGAVGAARDLVVRVAGRVSPSSPRYLPWLLRALHETGAAEALRELVSRVAADPDSEAMGDAARLLTALHAVGATEASRTLAARAVETAEIDDPYEVAGLLNTLRAAGADAEVRALLDRDPGRHAGLDGTGGVAALAEALWAAGAGDAVRTLASRAAAQVSLEDGEYTAALLRALHAAGDGEAIQVLLARDPAGQVSYMGPPDVAELLEALHTVGAEAQVRALAARAAEEPFYYLIGAPELARALRTVGATDVLGDMSTRAAAEIGIEDPGAVAELLEELRDAGSTGAVQTLLDRDPADHADLGDPWEVAHLLEALQTANAATVGALASRAADGVSLDDPQAIARLLQSMRTVGAVGAVRILAARAAHGADLRDPLGVAKLLEELNADDAVRILLARDPGRQVALDAGQPFRPGLRPAVARLLTALREAGAQDAERTLALRAADAGLFGLFLEARPGEAAAYRFGREPDGTPSSAWNWSEPADA